MSEAARSTQPTYHAGHLPAPDTVVVPGVCRFGDDRWDLTPLSPRPTARHMAINFSRCPEPFRDDLRHMLYLLLTVDTPLERLDRVASVRRRVAPFTVKGISEDTLPFLIWLHERRVPSLAAVTDGELRAYAHHVRDEPLGDLPKQRRLFAVSRFWLMAPYLRPAAQLRQPHWELEGIQAVLGSAPWSAENKTKPIHPATMSALLMWSLRLVEDGQLVAPILARDLPKGVQPADYPTGLLKWFGDVPITDPSRARQVLSIACLVTVAYLTGMRSDEVFGLSRGCCTPSESKAGAAISYEIHGRSFKNAFKDGVQLPEGKQRTVPWRAVKPVADAISIIEQLHDNDRLFSETLLKRFDNGANHSSRPPESHRVSEGLRALIEWANSRTLSMDRSHEQIPPDPDGPISMRRLRRTLAWFIYRRPGGRVALGIQYGHLQLHTTDGYGSRVSVGLRHVFPLEEAFTLRDTLQEAAERLDAGAGVSGPAADRYRRAASEFTARYHGLTLNARQARDMLANPGLRLYDSPDQLIACCFDASKALCRRDVPLQERQTPDLTLCDDRCRNIARTDEHIHRLQHQAEALRAEAADPTCPRPLAERMTTRAERNDQIATAHAQENP